MKKDAKDAATAVQTIAKKARNESYKEREAQRLSVRDRPDMHSCANCEAAFTRRGIAKHIKTCNERDERRFCHTCQTHFSRNSNRAVHDNTYHKSKQGFRCDRCEVGL